MSTIPIISLVLIVAIQSSSLDGAAVKFVPGVTWQPKSVVTADFTCRGRKEQAILGTTSDEIVVAVFINGSTAKPEVLRYSAGVRDAKLAKLRLESLNYNPRAQIGYTLQGFKRSRKCKGLNLSDNQVDSAHIYWNHDAKRFDDWVR